MRLLLFSFLFLNLFLTTAQTSQGILEGTLTDSKTHEDLIGTSVKVTQNGVFVKGSITDVNSSYRILLDPGVYEVEFTYTGYIVSRIVGIKILAGQTMQQNDSLSAYAGHFPEFLSCEWLPLINKSPGNTGFTFTSEMLRNTY